MSDGSVLVHRMSLAAMADFDRLVKPALGNKKISFTESLSRHWKMTGKTQPDSGARNPMTLSQSLTRVLTHPESRGHPRPSSGGPTAHLHFDVDVKQAYLQLSPGDYEPVPLRVDMEVPLTPEVMGTQMLMGELLVPVTSGARKVYKGAPENMPVVERVGSFILRPAAQDTAPVVYPTNERALRRGRVTVISCDMANARGTMPSWTEVFKPTRQFYEKRMRELDARYSVRLAPNVSVMPRDIHTSVTAAMAAREGVPLQTSSMPPFLFLQQIPLMPWEQWDESYKENIAAALIYRGWRQASRPDDPADVYAHALTAVLRAIGYCPDRYDNLLEFWKFTPLQTRQGAMAMATDCEDRAAVMMFLSELFVHCDLDKVVRVLQEDMKTQGPSKALVKRVLTLCPRDYTVVYATNCGDTAVTTTHHFALLMRTELLRFLRRERSTFPGRDMRQVVVCESMADLQLDESDTVGDESLSLELKQHGYWNVTTLSTFDRQTMLFGSKDTVGIPGAWLLQDKERHNLERVFSEDLFRADEFDAGVLRFLSGSLGAQLNRWRLSRESIIPVSDDREQRVVDGLALKKL